jgi:thiol-disulfide isomerase/thioredoxin
LVKVDASGYDIKFLDSTYAGKDVLLVLFGYDCPHCKRQLPAIKKLATNPRLKVLGIHAKSMIGDRRLRSYMRSAGINFDVLSFKNDIKLIRFLRDAGYYDDSVPSDILVHKDGRVEIVNEGTVLSKL